MDHDLLAALKTFTDPTRLRIIGRLATSPATSAELVEALDLSPAVVRRHLGRLTAAGLVAEATSTPTAPIRFTLRIEALDDLGRRLAALDDDADAAAASGPGVGPAGEVMPADEAKILRGFFERDRLVAIPSQHSKQLVVLRYLRDRCFTEDRTYPEKEVNQRLALFHPDVATLRRSMVDDGLMSRANGEYRRIP